MSKNYFSVLDSVIFDDILTHRDSNEYIIANPYLHSLREHPEFLKKHKLSKVERLLLTIRFKLIFIVRACQSIFGENYSHTNQESIKLDVLFVSHLTNETQLLKIDDAYYGDLPEQLSDCGVVSGIALLNHTKISKKKILKGMSFIHLKQ